jgi:hypothetical protein
VVCGVAATAGIAGAPWRPASDCTTERMR